MATTFTTNQTGANTDYMRYLSGPITKTDKVNAPDLLDFALIDYDAAMVPLKRGAHIVVTTAKYGVWFAGFITNDPELTYLGTAKPNVPKWGYKYEASGEEYMLNQKPFGIVAPFTNTTQGAVLKYLIDHLTPAGVTIDVSGIQDGLAIPRFIVDPNKHFTEIVQNFAKAAHFQFRCKNYVATYTAQDAVVGLTVDGTNTHFTPSHLNMRPAGDPIINDSIILGGIEPQNYLEEYFLGDGATAQFNLISSVFGVDSTMLIDDSLNDSSIDSSKWTVYDSSNGWITPYGGSLNVLGGTNNGSLDVYLQSKSLVPLEGNLRITHGEWYFTSASDGVLGGIWTGQCNSSMTGLLFGIRSVISGPNTILHPVVNGGVDNTQTVNVSYTKRYIMRTLLSSSDAKRNTPGYAYRDAAGAVHWIALTVPNDHFYATTIITEIDPITAVVTNQWTWANDLGAVTAVAAYYVPVASNNLHLTVCSVTVSVPMQATLTSMPVGAATWNQQIIGPNEVDALDGMSPAATIVDSNNGATTRNSLLGSASFNPGQATLTYFKETAQLKSYLPNPGDIVHLSYRSAGAAIGRAQSKDSITLEAAAWGDDGVRSETKRDLNPLPQTSLECEMAATARVNDNSYQHYSGSYTIPTGSWITTEPLAGNLIKFINLPAQFPSYLKAECITSVSTRILSVSPVEIFTHSIEFGPTSSLENVLAAIKTTNDVFTPEDTAEIPEFIDVTALGNTAMPRVPKFLYTGQDASNWFFTFTEAFPAGVYGVEVRYSDTGWGADDGNNLVSRFAAVAIPAYTPVTLVNQLPLFGRRSPAAATLSPYGFAIPRTARGKVAYLRCYDTRNQLKYSEDLTQSAWTKTSATTTKVRMKDYSSNWSMVNSIAITGATSTVSQVFGTAANNFGTFTVDLLGTAGNTVKLMVEAEGGAFPSTTQVVTFTGKWQRISVTSQTFGAGQAGTLACIIKANNATVQTVYAMRASFELGKSQESVYCKTNASAYGAVSRFSTGIHTGLPMIPPSPTAKGDFTDISAPLISAVLPADLTDVWGCEIRADDNSTVLFHTDLVNAVLSLPTDTGDTSMILQVTGPPLPSRAYGYWVYTYNLFGEYSTGYHYTATLTALPADVTGFGCAISGTSLVLTWSAVSGATYEVRYSDQPWPIWEEATSLWTGATTTWTDTTLRTGTYMVKAIKTALMSLNPAYTTPYPAPPTVTISYSSTNASGSGSTATAGDNISIVGGVITVASRVWVTVDWTWSASYRTPTHFEVVVYKGSDPSSAANYLFGMSTVDGSLRTFTAPVSPTSTLSTVNAAVRAVYA